MRQQFANQLAVVIAGAILLLAIIFAVYQSSRSPAEAQGAGLPAAVQVASSIPHPLAEYEGCADCLVSGAGLPFPADPDEYCAACHEPTVMSS